MSKYTNKTSIDFINDLDFEYVETYSFQRGEQFEKNLLLNRSEYEKLQRRKLRKNDLSDLQESRLNELKENVNQIQYILNDNGEFHPSCKKINTFKPTDQQTIELKSILKTEVINIIDWMCAPIYRDALVFYDKTEKITSCLNICLSCHHMQTTKANYIDADESAYDLLKQFFIKIGHNIE